MVYTSGSMEALTGQTCNTHSYHTGPFPSIIPILLSGFHLGLIELVELLGHIRDAKNLPSQQKFI